MSTRRLRIFAGPNGSGKSTVYEQVRTFVTDSARKLDLGVYVNADMIARQLQEGGFDFGSMLPEVSTADFDKYLETSELSRAVSGGVLALQQQYYWRTCTELSVITAETVDRIAQIIAQYLIVKLIQSGVKLSFETVFSHESKLDIMRLAHSQGYKVYLYFIATESAEINVDRVLNRVRSGGHAVDPDKVRTRYSRSLRLMSAALRYCHAAFFFDNSSEAARLFAHFCNREEARAWIAEDADQLPEWFVRNYRPVA